MVTEELLAAGAPVAAHWIADRQTAPSLLRYGTGRQKQRYLPAISRGEVYFALGMSEPDSGSDLASVRTRATQVDGGWRVSGTKVWTSGAHHAHAFVVLVRTSPLDTANRHSGLSQFIVPLDSPGVTVNPIRLLTGEHHFNEVVLDDVFVPDSLVLGNIGDGWKQVTSELVNERSGPERILSTYLVLALLVDALGGRQDGRGRRELGSLLARLATLRALSLDVAIALTRRREECPRGGPPPRSRSSRAPRRRWPGSAHRRSVTPASPAGTAPDGGRRAARSVTGSSSNAACPSISADAIGCTDSTFFVIVVQEEA